jgi:phosphorylase/glycogen(starch) synthase
MSGEFIFEVSWEVCNKVGGIHTVLRTKAQEAVRKFGDNYFLLGPDRKNNPEFEETDEEGWLKIREGLAIKEIPCRFGRWKIPGSPRVILVGSAKKFNKDQLLFELWEDYGVDSISGGWDYIEPVMFSYTCGTVIETVYNLLVRPQAGRAIAQFHEWMCGAGLLCIKKRVPEIGTVFTTHATILGRTLAGSGVDVGSAMDHISPQGEASSHNIAAKHSMETASAREADCFTTVSEISAAEAKNLLGRAPEVITPNGMDIENIPDYTVNDGPALANRARLMEFASRFLRKSFADNTRIMIISGRYEFHNKGIDIFLEALGRLDRENRDRDVIAFICVLGGHMSINPAALSGAPVPGGTALIATHRLQNEAGDPILNACSRLGLRNSPENKVNIIYVPAYLNGHDGLINMEYYETLSGCHLGVFPSYYEPWGYTPLESAAYAVPTITTDDAGFGLWARNNFGKSIGVVVLDSSDVPPDQTQAGLYAELKDFLHLAEPDIQARRIDARKIALHADWKDFYAFYMEAYNRAIVAASTRSARLATTEFREKMRYTFAGTASVQPHFRNLTAVVNLPEKISRLRELAYNLWWTWNPDALELFNYLDPKLLEETGNNPVKLLESISADRLAEAAENEGYVNLYQNIVARFDAYMKEKPELPADAIKPSAPVAYFSPEFGLHESVPIYSGGLGVLAGDLLKAASDLNFPFIGVSLLYKSGYFRQKIDRNGWQTAEFPDNDFSDMPVRIVQDDMGNDVQIALELPGRTLFANIWELKAGRVTLYLLDTDVPRNTVQDRKITSRLYNDDPRLRIEQELLLGMGGVKMLRKLGIRPSVYHINEGHSAFLIFELMNCHIIDEGLSFDEAREAVRGHCVFTTHTPVEAGNERFNRDVVEYYFSSYVKRWGISWSQFWELGRVDSGEDRPFFLTVLGLKLANMSNAVSRVHGSVARRMWRDVWKGFQDSDVPIRHITNGVHMLSFLSQPMRETLDIYLGLNWDRDPDLERWKRINDIPNSLLWRIRSTLKFNMVNYVIHRITREWTKYGDSKSLREEVIAKINPAALIVGFARRFAPYKRATLLFSDLDRLDRIVNNEKRPVHFIFAGKAHPNDRMGIELIKKIVDICNDKRFIGKIFFLEDYDLNIARQLVQGVDVWLNNPRRGMEACGTSGQKVLINGILNFSVMDGWWAEAYDGSNGFSIGPDVTEFTGFEDPAGADEIDAISLYQKLEDDIIPMFYDRDTAGIPQEWVRMVKNSMLTLGPVFNARRMAAQYLREMYLPTAKRGKALRKDNYSLSRQLADWKHKAPLRFSSIRLIDVSFEGIHGDTINVGEPFKINLRIDPGKLDPDEILAELVIGKLSGNDFMTQPDSVPLGRGGVTDHIITYSGEYNVKSSGRYSYGIRIIPYNRNLSSKQEMGMALWV